MTETLPPILTPELAGELLRCAPKTVEDMLRAGDLPGRKFGDSWVLPTVAFLEVVNEIARETMLELRAKKAARRAKDISEVAGIAVLDERRQQRGQQLKSQEAVRQVLAA